MGAKFRVLITDRPWLDSRIEREILSDISAEVIEAPSEDEATLVSLARSADAIATCWAKVMSPVIEAAEHCRIVCRMGIGLDNIAVETATRRGIPVTNVPAYCVDEVSDHTLALMLACLRKVALYHARTKSGEYALQAGPPMRRLSTLTLGLIGLGRTGRLVGRKAHALGMNVIACMRSRNGAGSPASDDGADRSGTGFPCQFVSLEELLARSDVVSLHAPLTDETDRLIGREQFALMKPSAYLINTSRGGLIDHAALEEALGANRLAGAGLDVFSPEPPDLSQPLYRDERVIVTPHAAFLSEESLVDLRTCVAHQIKAALTGGRPKHVVNPQFEQNR
ncbi:MAG: C-terminal binding protein [Planctomycetaceae bacterium]